MGVYSVIIQALYGSVGQQGPVVGFAEFHHSVGGEVGLEPFVAVAFVQYDGHALAFVVYFGHLFIGGGGEYRKSPLTFIYRVDTPEYERFVLKITDIITLRRFLDVGHVWLKKTIYHHPAPVLPIGTVKLFSNISSLRALRVLALKALGSCMWLGMSRQWKYRR